MWTDLSLTIEILIWTIHIIIKKILSIRFEDFVLKHEETAREMLSFIGISKDSRATNPRYKVEDSRKNIGLWKSYPNQKVIDRIATELKDYLFC
ncbi:MAG: hypothetical protein LBS14_01015 [Holosporaceae bacterium]|jgi:hypothetical protein|nr:hypothetical protein [Holosporaceae bacterium]